MLDDRGEPMVAVRVRLGSESTRGLWTVGTPKITDDRGVFTFSNLQPGRYLVAVASTATSAPAAAFADGAVATSADWRPAFGSIGVAGLERGAASLDANGAVLSLNSLAAVPQFDSSGRFLLFRSSTYGTSPTPNAAEVISLKEGEQRRGLVMHMNAPVSTGLVRGQLQAEPGLQIARVDLHLVPTGSDSLATDLDTASALTDAEGRFVFPAVPAGDYNLVSKASPPAAARATGPTAVVGAGGAAVSGDAVTVGQMPVRQGHARCLSTPVTVNGGDTTDVAPALHAGFHVAGAVTFEGATSQPAAGLLTKISVIADSADGRTIPFTSVTPGSDGRIALPELCPGNYLLRLVVPSPWHFRGAVVNGKDAADTPLVVADRDIDGVAFVLTDRDTTLSGTVRARQTRSQASLTVIAFPADRRLWPATRRLKSVRVATTGEYAIPDLPPGDYVVAALDDDPPRDWQSAGRLETLLGSGSHVSIAEGDHKTLDLASTVTPANGTATTLNWTPSVEPGTFAVWTIRRTGARGDSGPSGSSR